MAKDYSTAKKALVARVNIGTIAIEGLMLPESPKYKGVFIAGNSKFKSNLSEKCYQLGLHKLIGGEREQYCLTGIIDIATKDFVIEVKRADKIKSAIGQVLSYAFSTRKKPVIAFYGVPKLEELRLCNELGILLIDVSCCHIERKETIEDKVKGIEKTIFAFDYFDHDVLIERVCKKDLLAFAHIRRHKESVLANCLEKKDHYSLIKFWELVTGIEIYSVLERLMDEDLYPYLIVEETAKEMKELTGEPMVTILHKIFSHYIINLAPLLSSCELI